MPFFKKTSTVQCGQRGKIQLVVKTIQAAKVIAKYVIQDYSKIQHNIV